MNKILRSLLVAGLALFGLFSVLQSAKAQSELFTNSDMTSLSNWSYTSGVTFDGTYIILSTIHVSAISQTVNVPTDGLYELSYTFSGNSSSYWRGVTVDLLNHSRAVFSDYATSKATPTTKTRELYLDAGSYTFQFKFTNSGGGTAYVMMDSASLQLASRTANSYYSGGVTNGGFYGYDNWTLGTGVEYYPGQKLTNSTELGRLYIPPGKSITTTFPYSGTYNFQVICGSDTVAYTPYVQVKSNGVEIANVICAKSDTTGTVISVTQAMATDLVIKANSAYGLYIDDVGVFDGDIPDEPPSYNPTISGTITGTTPGPIGPIPIGSAGETCYLCNSPTGSSMYYVSHWVAWLGCVLRNLFACDLRVWFLITWNWLRGFMGYTTAWFAWIPTEAQNALNWGSLWFQGWVDWFNENGVTRIAINYYDNGTNIWDLLIALVGLIGDLLGMLSGLLLGLLRMIGDFATALLGIFDVSSIEFEFSDGTTLEEAVTTAQGQTGGSKEKLVYVLLLGAGLFDRGVGNAVVASFLAVALGVASIYMLYHLVQEYQMLDF